MSFLVSWFYWIKLLRVWHIVFAPQAFWEHLCSFLVSSHQLGKEKVKFDSIHGTRGKLFEGWNSTAVPASLPPGDKRNLFSSQQLSLGLAFSPSILSSCTITHCCPPSSSAQGLKSSLPSQLFCRLIRLRHYIGSHHSDTTLGLRAVF